MSGDRTSPRYEMIASTRRRWLREQKLAILAEVDGTGGVECREDFSGRSNLDQIART
jgi:hypothetical protein